LLSRGGVAIGARASEDPVAERKTTATGNVSLVSDYVFRGVSQTKRGPGLQGGLDWNHASGAFVGAWGSNVFANGTGPYLEIDLYGGYRHWFDQSLSLSAGFLHYTYFRAGAANTLEFPVRVSYDAYYLSYAFAPNWLGSSSSGSYVSAGWDTILPYEFRGGVSAGYSVFGSASPFRSYGDLRLSLTREIYGFTLGVAATLVSRRQFAGDDAPELVASIARTL